jgi:hypothetical protein
MTPTPKPGNTVIIRCRNGGPAETLTSALDQAYPVDRVACFDKVLKAIDDAERQLWGSGAGDGDQLD